MPPLFPVRWTCALAMFPLLAACGDYSSDPSGSAAPRPSAARADPLLGQRLITQYQCGSCHAIPGVAAARGRLGPSLQAFGKRSYIAGRVPNSADALAQWLVAPASLVPDTTMPSMGVSQEEARHMAAYLGQLE
ncbi:c-type cytochrome [Polaromonas sp. YR568]|uniref:c-type cytochrome n=1 Tax=Polaromonas sp. YR568 TaxID=1855301 RepID=UPI00398BBDE7